MSKTAVIFSILLMLPFAGGLSTVEAKEYADIVLESKASIMKKADVKAVMFPHWFHRIRFKCKVCHENIFIMQKGANDISMKKIMDGKFCGACHNGLIAWEPLFCDKCHSADFTASPLANSGMNLDALSKTKTKAKAKTKTKAKGK